MSFYDRYETICRMRGLRPMSQQAADLIGASRGRISKWKTDGYTPRGDFVQHVADCLRTTPEYLLGKTDDPTPPRTDKNSEMLLHYNRLDESDQAKVDSFILGLLSSDKYEHLKDYIPDPLDQNKQDSKV